jgi:3-hydroxymyristoyl/3-hydroxydecanoyl-(acyl carrier protein) dehydratase
VLASLLPGAERKMAYFAAIDRCRFRRPVTPGDQLITEVTVLRARDRVVKMSATCRANGEIVADAVLTASMVDLENVNQGLVGGKIVDLEEVES